MGSNPLIYRKIFFYSLTLQSHRKGGKKTPQNHCGASFAFQRVGMISIQYPSGSEMK